MTKFIDTLSEENAKILAELIVDPTTSDHVRVAVLNKLMEARKDRTFFEAIFEDKLSFGACPNCEHENHWLIPEDSLNKLGYVTAAHDPRVKKHTKEADCKEFQEACAKRKINP